MVKKIRHRFIALSMVSLFLLLSVVVAGMNSINYHAVVENADEMLTMLSHNDGRFPDKMTEPKPDKKPKHMNGETPFETRFFSVVLNASGDCVSTDTSRIALVKSGEAVELAQRVRSENKDSGFEENYRYVVVQQDENIRVTFLDCRRDLQACRTFLQASIWMAVAGYVLVSVVIVILSGRIVRPVAESYEKQKRFITDAGHEIKTPLTIIHANLDLLEADCGENESIRDIRQQTKRLAELTNKMVRLAKMEETQSSTGQIDFLLSDLVEETVASFRPLASDRQFETDIQPMLSMHGREEEIRELVNILMDNAVKYSVSGGLIRASLSKSGRHVSFTVENTTENTVTKEDEARLFDRFYRTDPSRNSETGGYGIGLSMAKAIVELHGGTIHAQMHGENVFCITATFQN